MLPTTAGARERLRVVTAGTVVSTIRRERREAREKLVASAFHCRTAGPHLALDQVHRLLSEGRGQLRQVGQCMHRLDLNDPAAVGQVVLKDDPHVGYICLGEPRSRDHLRNVPVDLLPVNGIYAIQNQTTMCHEPGRPLTRGLLDGVCGSHSDERIGVKHARDQGIEERWIPDDVGDHFFRAANRTPVAATQLVEDFSHDWESGRRTPAGSPHCSGTGELRRER